MGRGKNPSEADFLDAELAGLIRFSLSRSAIWCSAHCRPPVMFVVDSDL